MVDWVPDRGRTPLESLREAWQILCRQLQTLRSQVIQQRRTTRPGRQRKSHMDTGVDGVLIARRRAKHGRSAAISVRMIQRIATPEGKSRGVGVNTVHISETKYLESPKHEQRRLEQGLREATAIRAHYLSAYAQAGGPVPSPITLADIDPRTIPSAPKVAINLETIFQTMADEEKSTTSTPT